jgi:putative peptide zinc metalloprotease protein
MDGEHTLEDIGRAYHDEYGRTLGPDNWRQMFILLGRYQLLDGDVDEGVLERIRSDRAAKEKDRPDSWLSKRWVLVHPDRVCAALAGRLSFVFHRAFVMPALVLIVLSQIVVWGNTGLLVADATSHGWQVVAPVTLLLAWLITMVHELAHGVACRYFGGEVTEIGVRWRFPLLAPYCRTDDIVLFHRRTARIGTAFAGAFVGLVAMLPVLAWWWFSAEGGMSRSMAAGLLLFGSGGSLVALMPFMQLDGYVMLTHSLDVADLRADMHQFWRLQLHRRRPENREALGAYPSRLARAYALYGLASLFTLIGVYCALMWLWHGTLDHYLGSVWAVVILATETALVAGLAAYVMRGRSHTKKAADG